MSKPSRIVDSHQHVFWGDRDECGRRTHDFLQTLKLPQRVVENIYHRNADRLVAFTRR